MKNNISDLLAALSESLTAEEIMLTALQSSVSAEIAMKRLELGMNQKQFAKHMGVSQAIISRWENGDANFTLKTLVDIASKLNIPMQSPFATNPPTHYYSAPSNVINISDYNKWNGHSTPSQPEYTVLDLEEM